MFKNFGKFFTLTAIIIISSGCSTVGTFKVPNDSQLYINNQQVTVEDNGEVETRPYFWSAAGGVKYRLEKNGATLKEGKLRTKFRPVSIFWPPYAIIYWPMGLHSDIVYDLVNDKQE